MSRRLDKTLVDYIVIAINPVLIMFLIGSLLYFLLEVFYQGRYDGRLQVIFALFVMAAVLIGRIAIEQGRERAQMFGAPLAVVTYLALLRFVRFHGAALDKISWLVNLLLIGLVWWCAHKLTWDCTLIDEDQDASGEGLLHTAGLEEKERAGPKSDVAPPPEAEGVTARDVQEGTWWDRFLQRSRRPHAPGVWVVYFSLVALPLFGFGQLLVPADDMGRRRQMFFFLIIYVASGLGLLMNTSFLGLRRYLRQRRVEMPAALAGLWLAIGSGVIVALLAAAALLPRPNAEYAFADLSFHIGSPTRGSSRTAMGTDGADEDQGGPRTGTKETDEPPPDDGGGGKGSGSESGSESGGKEASSSGQQSAGGNTSSGSRNQSNGSRSQSNGQQSDSGRQQSGSGGQQSDSGRQQSGSGGQQSDSGRQQSGSGRQQSGSRSQDGQGTQSRSETRSGQSSSEGQGQPSGSESQGDDRDSGADAERDGSRSASNQGKGTRSQSERRRDDSQESPAGRQSRSSAGAREDDSEGEGEDSGDDEQSRTGGRGSDSEEPQEEASRDGDSQSGGGRQSSPNPLAAVMSAGGFLFGLLKWIIFLAILAFGFYWIWRSREELLRFWRDLVKSWREFLARLFGRTPAPEAETPEEETAKGPAPRPFGDYVDPFLSGAVDGWSPDQVVEYTFEALEAWARERGCPRGLEQTPYEFNRRFGKRFKALSGDTRHLSDLYYKVAYAPGTIPPGSIEPLRDLWLKLSQPEPASV